MKIKSSTLLLALLFAISAAAQTARHFDGQTWWNHVKVLADDKLEGRETGSRGERAAQAYAVEQLKSAGAEPAGINGFYQPVKFVSRQIVEKDCSLTLIRDGKREALTLGEDVIISTRVMPAPEVEAPLVFVGYGLKVPEKNYDDFTGVDVRGKIIVVFSGSPSEIPGALASHYQTAAERWKVLRAAGAVGMVSLINPNSMDIPWSRIALNRAHPTMDLDYPEFNETEGAKVAVTVNPASAEKFFAGSGSALVLDMAASFKKNPEKLRRSILLVLVTGEEKGLLGSKYFAAHPTVAPKSIAADVNVDMFLPIVPLKFLTVLGLDDSDLGDRAREIAQSQGVKVQPDPEPLRNLFVRSDQYNFIRHGIPSVIMSVAPEPSSPEEKKIFKDWLTQRYHAPSDDVDQPVNLAAAAKYEEIVRALLINIANDDHRPEW